MNRRLLLLGCVALAGCAGLPVTKVVAPSSAGFAELEPVFLVRAGPDAIVVRVSSNGCTTKTDFAAYVEHNKNILSLAVGRKHLDTCKSFVMGHADLTYTYAELGLTPRTQLFLLNPLVAWTGPGE